MRSSAAETQRALQARPTTEEAAADPLSTVGIEKPEFLQLRDQMIAEGLGPADIVFGPDLFDPGFSETYAPYSDALPADAAEDGAAAEDSRPVSELFGTDDEALIQEKIREHVAQVVSADEDTAGPAQPTEAGQ